MSEYESMTSKTFYSPLSQRVRPFLVMSQARAAKANARLSITRRFVLGSTHWLLVTNPQDQSSQEVSIDWLSPRYEGVFAALLPAYMSFDPSDGAVEHTIVEVINKTELRILNEQEIAVLLPHIQAEIVGRRIWTEDLQQSTLFGDIKNSLGTFSEEPSVKESDAVDLLASADSHGAVPSTGTDVSSAAVASAPVASDSSENLPDSAKSPRKRRFF